MQMTPPAAAGRQRSRLQSWQGPLPQHCPPGSVAPTLPSPAGGRIRGGGRDVVCVLQAPKLGDVLVECLLAIGTELIAALRKQYVTGDDVFLLLLHFVDLALLSR